MKRPKSVSSEQLSHALCEHLVNFCLLLVPQAAREAAYEERGYAERSAFPSGVGMYGPGGASMRGGLGGSFGGAAGGGVGMVISISLHAACCA